FGDDCIAPYSPVFALWVATLAAKDKETEEQTDKVAVRMLPANACQRYRFALAQRCINEP
ncbi:MAG: hypothetical protein MJZ99_09335, partial [Bacteroidales bacterium]|nr:hypothetical protein [Bacteroidales bacterium]